MDKKWITLGISGVTNGGKTTLTNILKRILSNVTIIAQDSYFLPEESPKHVLVPELNHFNWEVLSSLDMERMHDDIKKILKNEPITTKQLETVIPDIKISSSLEDTQELKRKLKPFNLLIIEGFCIFNYEPIDKLCDLKFYVTLNKEECYQRRVKRTYEPPDVPGYFEKIVWPEHLKQLCEVKEKCKDVIFLTQDNDNHLRTIIKHLLNFL